MKKVHWGKVYNPNGTEPEPGTKSESEPEPGTKSESEPEPSGFVPETGKTR